MSPNEMRSGVATYGRPRSRRRPIVYEPVSPIHEPCQTDTERGDCPPECPPETREERR